MLAINPAAWLLIEAAGFAKRGLLPVTGGLLDQAAVALSGIRFVWAEQAHWRAEFKLPVMEGE